jgi:hypothetical protein
MTSCPLIIILENILNLSTEKCGYRKFNQWYTVSSIHLRAILGVENFTNLVRVGADRL